MRLWSIHPEYLDQKGLIALWREALLAKNVLMNHTKGYKNHSQLTRFKNAAHPLHCINQYLEGVYQESLKRGYHFNSEKFSTPSEQATITVNSKQIAFEMQHLLKKLKVRDPERYFSLLKVTEIKSHPLFVIIDGDIESWEIIKEKVV